MVKSRSADNEYIARTLFEFGKHIFHGMNADQIVAIYALRANYYIFSFGQRLAAGKGQKSVITHTNRAIQRFLSEKLHILGEVKKQIVLLAYPPLFVYGDYGAYHMATSNFSESGVAS